MISFSPYTLVEYLDSEVTEYENGANPEYRVHDFPDRNITLIDLSVFYAVNGHIATAEDVFKIYWKDEQIEKIVESFDHIGWEGDYSEKRFFYNSDKLAKVEIWSNFSRDTLNLIETMLFEYQNGNVASISTTDIEGSEVSVDFVYDEADKLNPLFNNFVYLAWSKRFDLFLSKNSLLNTTHERYGSDYQYVYDEHGLPLTTQYVGEVFGLDIDTVDFAYAYDCE